MRNLDLKFEIRSQSEQLRLIASLRGKKRAFCPKCDRPVELVAHKKAASLLKSDIRGLATMANVGTLHRLHNIRGRLLICSNSLYTFFDNRSTVVAGI